MTTNHLPAAPDIKALLAKRGMSQTVLARESKIGEADISRIVRGMRPGKDQRERVAKALGMKEAELWPTT